MTARTSRIRRLKSLILALPLLALPIIAAAQGDSSAKPIITHSQYTKLRAQLEPLYVKHGVAVVFSGHSHCYERIKPQKGVHYFTEGASGEIKRRTLDRTTPYFAAGEDEKHSFLIVQASESELKVEAIGADGSLIDSYTIKRATLIKP